MRQPPAASPRQRGASLNVTAGPRSAHGLVAALMLLAALAAAAPAGDPPENKRDAKVLSQLAQAWDAFYAGRHQRAATLAGPIVKLEDDTYRNLALQAGHLQARCLWAHGSAPSRRKARDLWDRLSKVGRARLGDRVRIVEALEIEATDGADLNKAADILARIVGAKSPGPEAPEAALDLGRIYVKLGRFDEAEKVLRFARDFARHDRSITRAEIPARLAAAWARAAKAALKDLVYQRDAGRAEFEAARRLYDKGRYAAAYEAFGRIVEKLPATPYAPRGALAQGHCLADMGKPAQALAHWERFVQSAPAGPWRGQALVALIDLILAEKLDLTRADKYARIAAASIPLASDNPDAAESWRQAAADIHLRIGMIRFCSGQDEQAAEAFARAATDIEDEKAAEGLERLIAAATSGKGVIPEECRAAGEGSPAHKAQIALSMGVITLLSGRNKTAEGFFRRITGVEATDRTRGRRPYAPATDAQRAFGIFGVSAVAEGAGELDAAIAGFQACLKAEPDASWHDETLYRLATCIQDRAEAKFGSASSAAGAKATEPASSGSGRAAKRPAAGKAQPLTARQREAAAKAEKERLAALLKARAEALPYWRELIKTHPKSPRVEQAMYNAGVLLCELAEAASRGERGRTTAAQAEKAWKEAAFMLNRFCDAYPKSPLAGDAYVRQVDIALERMFDLELSNQLAVAAIAWAAQYDKPTIRRSDDNVNAGPWVLHSSGTADVGVGLYHVNLRAGLVAYLKRDYSAASRHFASAQLLRPHPADRVVAGEASDSMTALCEKARTQGELTPKEVQEGDSKAALALQIADIYNAAAEFEKSVSLCDLVLDGRCFSASLIQKSWAHFLRGRNRFGMDWGKRDPVAAMSDYEAAQRLAPKAAWSHRCLLYAANITFKRKHDADAAIVIWKRLIREYPASTEAQIAHYHIAVAYERSKRPKEARQAFEALLKKYPDSPYMDLVEQYHLKRITEMDGSPQAKGRGI